MKLLYQKILFQKNNRYYHLCILETDKQFTFKNFDYVHRISNNLYAFDLQYGLFDNLSESGMKYLDNINRTISKSNYGVNYINKYLWNNFKLLESIEDDRYNNSLFYEPKLLPVFTGDDIKLEENEYEIVDKNTLYNDKNYNKEDGSYTIKTLDIDKKELLKIYKNANAVTTTLNFAKSSKDLENIYNLMTNIKKYKAEKKYLIELWECSFDIETEIDLINVYLNIIFSLENTYNLIKCENCNKYFISKPGGTKRCDRIYKYNLTCREIKDKIRRQHNNAPIKKLEKQISDLVGKQCSLYGKYEEYDRYHDNKKELKEKYFNDSKEYILWLLSFYKTRKKIEEKIEEYNLTTYGITITDITNISEE